MSQTTKNYSSLWCKGVLPLLLMLAMLVGCTPTPSSGSQTLRIGVAIYDQTDTFISTVVQQMEAVAQEEEMARNIKISLSIQDGRGNQTVQSEQVDRFIDQAYDIICVNIVDRTAAAVLIDKAEKAGIPLLFFNRQPVDEDITRWEQVYYVGAQAKDSGALQGEIVHSLWQADRLSVDKNDDGILQYVMLEGEPGHQDALLRTQYSVSALTSAGIHVEKLGGYAANWSRGQAADKMSQWLSELDTPIEVVFANNDDMALGAIDTYLKQGYALDNLPVVVGVDAIPAALDALKVGTLAGTVLNDSVGMTEAMLSLSLSLWQGDDPAEVVDLKDDHYVWLAYQALTKEDIS